MPQGVREYAGAPEAKEVQFFAKKGTTIRMNLLLLCDRSEVLEKTVFVIESSTRFSVKACGDFSGAMLALRSAAVIFDLIAVDALASSAGAEALAFCRAIEGVPVLMTGGNHALVQVFKAALVPLKAVLEPKFFLEQLLKDLRELEGQKNSVALGLPTQCTDLDYIKVKTKLLLSVSPLEGDVFIRLSENKYIRLFGKGDVFDLKDLEKYTTQKGVIYLYISKSLCTEFISKYRSELIKQPQNKETDLESQLQLEQSVQETVQELVNKIGFTEEVQKITRTHVDLSLKVMTKAPRLKELIDKLKKNSENYLSAHTVFCAYLSCAIAGQMEWGSNTTFYKLSLASFLHDISLENDVLTAITTREQLEAKRAQFTEKEIHDFLQHPMTVGDMVQKMSEVPPDVDTIIRQHHESPDGSGFPRGLTYSHIAPLSCVFIVAHDVTSAIFRDGPEQFQINQFLEANREKYKASQFRKIMACLKIVYQSQVASASSESGGSGTAPAL